ncbi:hypothetical protein [Terriglobus roseus]|uniref:hypothetical protein n=1 Tax=Terriglobus roseus TaxID=392734 RepID=UPI001114E5ED|nr:hypothetical protein [Terriglobus roseus]
MPDPALGIAQGTLPILPGWRGEAHIDRTSDPLSYAIGTLTADLRSPDGSSSIQMLAVPFHTLNVSPQLASAMPGDPARQRNAALLRFTSTADLLKQHILPALGLDGRTAHYESMEEEARRRMREQSQTPGNIFDRAFALLQANGKEVAVYAQTMGGGAGTPREVTSTTILVCTAPIGKAMSVLQAQENLSTMPPSGAWQQANERYLGEWRQALQEKAARSTREFERDNAAIISMGHANIVEMQARGAARDRAFVEHEQQISDHGAMFRGYLSGTSTTFKWCGTGGATTYTVDETRAPAAGFRRCD